MARPLDRRNQVVTRLREALRNGKLRPGMPLRTGVADAAAWGTSHPTFRAALRELESAGELELAPRGFRVPMPTVRGESTNVLWIAACDLDGTISGEFERETRLRRHLDLACRKHGLRLRVAGTDTRSRLYVEGTPSPDIEASLKGVFGVVLCPWRMGPEGLDLAERLSRSNLPSALWAEGGVQESVLSASRARIFDNGHMSAPGLGVGIHLRELGHDRIAFLSIFHEANWSRRRLEGLRKAIEPGGTVVPFVVDRLPDAPFAPDRTNVDLLPELLDSDGARQSVSRDLADFRAARAHLLRNLLFFKGMEHLLEMALAESSISAWVFSNDRQALLALQWLRERGVDIPGRISIVGFDDSNRGQDLGLTSWSFSEFDLAEAMVHHLLHPTIGTGMVRIEGALVVRGSTGRHPG